MAAPLGIIAGRGGLPGAVAAAVLATGRPVVQFAMTGMAQPIAGATVVPFPPYRIGALVAGAKAHGVSDLLLVGQVDRPDLRVRFDLTTLRFIRLLLTSSRGGDDKVMRRVTSALESLGFRVVSIAEVAPSLVAPAGQLGRHAPAPHAMADIALGLSAVSMMGQLDIGQAVVVRKSRVIAVEAAEGTDAMIKRAGALGARDGVLVKASKPQQELRNDMPTVGMDTLEASIAAGLSTVAVAAGRVVLVDLQDMVRRADEAGIALIGVEPSP